MSKQITPLALKKLYKEGQNISSLLRDMHGSDKNTREIIEAAYDLQAGSYIAMLDDEDIAKRKDAFCDELAGILEAFPSQTILEAGVGEATTLASISQRLSPNKKAYGFDISWSRLSCGMSWLREQGLDSIELCVGDLFDMPYLDSSIDVVYTAHSIEPNGGNEIAALKELYRVTKKYLVMVEPAYEFASAEVQERMDKHGYCKGLKEKAIGLGYKVIECYPMDKSLNHFNPSCVTIIEKETNTESDASDNVSNFVYACPKYKSPLNLLENGYFSETAQAIYPIVGGIPCLRMENKILASILSPQE